MEKFVSYEKMSKKQQKIVNASKRGNWGNEADYQGQGFGKNL